MYALKLKQNFFMMLLTETNRSQIQSTFFATFYPKPSKNIKRTQNDNA